MPKIRLHYQNCGLCLCFSPLLQLLEAAMEQASELFRRNEDHELLSGLRAAGLNGEVQRAEQLTVHFAEHQEQLEEVVVCPCSTCLPLYLPPFFHCSLYACVCIYIICVRAV